MKMQQLRQEQNKSRKMFWSLAGLLDKKEKKELHLCIVFSVLSPLVDWGSMVALVLVFGRLSEPGIFRGLFGQVVFLGIIFLIKGLYVLLRKKISNNLLKNLAHIWSVKIYELYSKEELPEHNQRSVMQQVTGVRTDTEVSADILVTFINRFSRVVTFGGYFLIIAYEAHWIGVLVCLFAMAVVMLPSMYCLRRIQQYSERKRKGDIKTASLVTTSYGAYKEIKMDSRADHLLEKYKRISMEHVQVQKEFAFMTDRLGVISQSLIPAGIFFMLAAILAAGIDMSYFWADIIICITILIQLFPNAVLFIVESNRIQFGKKNYEVFYGNMKRYFQLKEKEEREQQLRRKQITFRKGVRMENLTFRYPNGKEIFRDASVEIPAGHSVAIIGSSGIGKTTFLDLLMGLLTPQSGHIWYDDFDLTAGRDAEGPCRADLGSVVSYIPQSIYLNGDTIRSNVVFMAEEENEERIISCLKRARIWEDVKEMADGLDTLIGENGTALSGGQRQRIALARALYKEFELLIMDEATAALDMETEREVMKDIHQMEGDKTILLVTHHLNLAGGCEFVYKIEDKKLVKIR